MTSALEPTLFSDYPGWRGRSQRAGSMEPRLRHCTVRGTWAHPGTTLNNTVTLDRLFISSGTQSPHL